MSDLLIGTVDSIGPCMVTLDGADTATVAHAGWAKPRVGSRVVMEQRANELYVVGQRSDITQYYEEANIDNFTLSNGWNTLTCGIVTTKGNQGSHVNTSNLSFTAPANGVYSFGFSGYTTASASSARFLAQCATGSAGTGQILFRDENDLATDEFVGFNVCGEKFLTAGSQIFYSVWCSGGLVGATITGEQVFVRLVERCD